MLSKEATHKAVHFLYLDVCEEAQVCAPIREKEDHLRKQIYQNFLLQNFLWERR